jgi:alpha-L-fucosidase 2
MFHFDPRVYNRGGPSARSGTPRMDAAGYAARFHPLPALPKAWANGSFRGLRARGNITVDAEWREGQLVKAVLYAPKGPAPALRLGGAPLPARDRRIKWSQISAAGIDVGVGAGHAD